MKNRNEQGLVTFIGFIILVIVLGVLGYLLINRPQEEVKETEEEKVYKRIDDSKDFVYYTNEEVLSEEGNLVYKDIVINLDSDNARTVENKLNKDMQSIRGLYTKISDDVDKNSIIYNYDDIYEAKMIDYNVYSSDNYLTINVVSYNFNANLGVVDEQLSYYVFDKYSGRELNNQDIMKNESLMTDKIRAVIYDYIKDIDNVDIDVTMNNEYKLTYNEFGKVVVNIIVKLGDLTYNDSIIIN